MSSRALLHAYHRQGDLGARDRLIEDYLPLVGGSRASTPGAGSTLEDLVQVGSIGLINAIDRFELDRGVDLAAYAIPSIVGEIKRHLRDRVGPIRIPRRLQEVNASLRASAAGLAATLERPATVAEVAREAGVERDVALEALVALRSHEPVSLSRDANGEGPEIEVKASTELGYETGEDRALAGEGLPRPRPAGAAAPPSRLLRRHEPGSDRAARSAFRRFTSRVSRAGRSRSCASRSGRARNRSPKARLCSFLAARRRISRVNGRKQ